MEPVWLGLAGPTVVSTAAAVTRSATQPFAAALDAARKLLHSATEPAPTTLVEDIRTDAAALQDSLQRRIHQLLKSSGVKLEDEVQLSLSSVDGQLEIVGDTPHRAVLEAALANDPSVAADFRRVAALRSLINAADQHSGFSEAYARDPYQAVAEYTELFDESSRASLFFSSATELRFEFS